MDTKSATRELPTEIFDRTIGYFGDDASESYLPILGAFIVPQKSYPGFGRIPLSEGRADPEIIIPAGTILRLPNGIEGELEWDARKHYSIFNARGETIKPINTPQGKFWDANIMDVQVVKYPYKREEIKDEPFVAINRPLGEDEIESRLSKFYEHLEAVERTIETHDLESDSPLDFYKSTRRHLDEAVFTVMGLCNLQQEHILELLRANQEAYKKLWEINNYPILNDSPTLDGVYDGRKLTLKKIWFFPGDKGIPIRIAKYITDESFQESMIAGFESIDEQGIETQRTTVERLLASIPRQEYKVRAFSK